jgi:hypothetical protein
MGADSCGTTTKSTPDSPSSDKQTPTKKTARLGDVITLTGQEDGSKVAVRLLKIIDPVSGGQFDKPTSTGRRFIGVKIRLTNQGTTTYADSPSNGATLIVSGDEQADTSLLSEGICGTQFGSSAKISPGTRQTGCLAFEAPKSRSPRRFQFTLNSGFGPATGEWTVVP